MGRQRIRRVKDLPVTKFKLSTAIACSIDGIQVFLDKKIVKRIFTIFKNEVLSATFTFFSKRVRFFRFLLSFATFRDDLPVCSVKCLALGPDVIC